MKARANSQKLLQTLVLSCTARTLALTGALDSLTRNVCIQISCQVRYLTRRVLHYSIVLACAA